MQITSICNKKLEDNTSIAVCIRDRRKDKERKKIRKEERQKERKKLKINIELQLKGHKEEYSKLLKTITRYLSIKNSNY